MNQNKSPAMIKLGIYAISFLMMGVVGVSGALTVIGEHFAGASQSMIQSIVSVPCLTVLPATIICGKVMDYLPKKTLALIGIILFLVGGIAPAFLDSLPLILVLRGVLGIGIGAIQTTSSALVAENFVGEERAAVQGVTASAQMIGCAVMVLAGGWLASVGWNVTFYVHALGIIVFVFVALCLPTVKPEKKAVTEKDAHKTTLNKSSWSWALITFLMFFGIQVFTVYMSALLQNKDLGGSVVSSASIAIADIGGFIMGLLFGRLSGKVKNLTLSVGLICMGVSYLVIGLASSIAAIFIGSFLYGLALAICIPVVTVNTANSVDVFSAAMALSITMCAQNLAQFLCPYLLNYVLIPLFGSFTAIGTNELAYLLGAAILLIMGVCAVFWGVRRRPAEVPEAAK